MGTNLDFVSRNVKFSLLILIVDLETWTENGFVFPRCLGETATFSSTKILLFEFCSFLPCLLDQKLNYVSIPSQTPQSFADMFNGTFFGSRNIGVSQDFFLNVFLRLVETQGWRTLAIYKSVLRTACSHFIFQGVQDKNKRSKFFPRSSLSILAWMCTDHSSTM